jgi:hypothetical protein
VLKSVEAGDCPRPRKIKPTVDAALEAICLKAMARAPSDRYTSAALLRKDLENWIADAPVTAWPEPLRVKARRFLGRHRVLAAAGLASLVLAALFLGVLAAITSDANMKLKKLAEDESAAKSSAEIARKDADREKDNAIEQTRIANKQTELADKRAEDLLESSRQLAFATGFAAVDAFSSGLVDRANEYLDQIPVNFRNWEWRYRALWTHGRRDFGVVQPRRPAAGKRK